MTTADKLRALAKAADVVTGFNEDGIGVWDLDPGVVEQIAALLQRAQVIAAAFGNAERDPSDTEIAAAMLAANDLAGGLAVLAKMLPPTETDDET